MDGFWHYFLSTIDPTLTVGFSTALPEMELSAPSWFVLILLASVTPTIIVGLLYLVKSTLVRPPLVRRPGQVDPLVTVLIAGRNESATIGQCITAALRCGYSNIEVVFVDDDSSDDSVAIARRAALRVTGSRQDTDRVRIFPSPRRNGKASSLNIGLSMARGEFIVIHDADSIIQYGIMPHWLLPFADPSVGGVAANIRVQNSTANLLTRLQELEYALKFTMDALAQTKFGIRGVISGMGGIFRAEILRKLGGFDTGLGDDSDLSTMLLKQGWKFGYSNDAVVWTTVPETRDHLWKQRMRWRRNLIKVRVSKHRDMYFLGRYGFPVAVMNIMLALRILVPLTCVLGMIYSAYKYGVLSAPEVVRAAYWIMVFLVLVRMLIARDIANTPKWANFPLILIYPFYELWLLLPVIYAEWAELLRIGAKHPYVPDHIWKEIPWW
jgi:poly-beta-1,6-N-acetyl-D-glucosamine synthase